MLRRAWIAPFACAALGGALVLIWQALTVHFNYHGDWDALFYTGGAMSLPPEIAEEDVYRFPDSRGYDGAFYHMIAHDPLMRHGYANYVDNPGLRWRRILVPGLARMAALGDGERVDSAYICIVDLFLCLGVYWLARYAAFLGWNAAWGLAFLSVPAALTSLDRMTVDGALAALCAGFAFYAAAKAPRRLYAVLVLAPLARETGMALIAGWCLFQLLTGRWRRAAFCATAALPAVCWFIYVRARTGPDQTRWTSWIPFEGIVERTLHPVQFALTSRWLREAAVLDNVALAGVWMALGIAVWWLARKNISALTCSAWIFAAGALFLANADIWSESYSFSRTQSPLLMSVGLEGMRAKRWWKLAPLALAAPRILFQLQPQWRAVLHGLRGLI